MARKPCAQDVLQLDVSLCVPCFHTKNPRIARNAILPFYLGPNGKKVFYIKNPAYYSGVAANNPGSLVTQAMQCSRLANQAGATSSRRQTIFLPACKRVLPPLFNRLPT